MTPLNPFQDQSKNLKANKLLKREFIIAMKLLDLSSIEEFLSDDGIYFGQPKLIFKSKIKKLENKIDKLSTSYAVGNSVGIYPGEIVHEFIYTLESNNNEYSFEEEDMDFIESMKRKYREIGSKLDKNQFSIKLICLFQNGEIVKICTPTKYTTIRERDRYVKEN